jgi:hypothetical protein
MSEPKPCNEDVLKRLAHVEEKEEDEDGDDNSDDQEGDPRWNKLKDLLN